MKLSTPATFQELTLPAATRLAGAAALVYELGLSVPVRRLACVSHRHVSGSRRSDGSWIVFDTRYWPGDQVTDHLTFMLKHEDADFLVLRRIFEAMPQTVIEAHVRAAPTARHTRRMWFLYETLSGCILDIADAPGVAAIDLLEANDRMRDDRIDPVLQAAATAFAFVYVHPFEDGNGRLHRCFIHHVLAERRFTPTGMVFPVSSVMLDRIDDYRDTLQAQSRPLMPFIQWRPTQERNVEVLNDTADFFRYFDCTEAAEFLYACVRRTVEDELPREIDYLRRHDEAIQRIMEAVEIPDRIAEELVMFIRQNNGVLPRKRREGTFKELSDEEVRRVESIVVDAFVGFEGAVG